MLKGKKIIGISHALGGPRYIYVPDRGLAFLLQSRSCLEHLTFQDQVQRHSGDDHHMAQKDRTRHSHVRGLKCIVH